MKRILKVLGVAAIIAVFAITMAGCSRTSAVKTAFKNAGYEIVAVEPKDSTDLTGLLKTDEQKEQIGKYEVFTCTYYERSATVIVFPSEKVMTEVLGESTFKTKSEGGYIKGKCYLIKSCTDAFNIFNNV